MSAISDERGDFQDFVRGGDIWSKWDAARRLMATRQMQSAANKEGFAQSFRDLGKFAVGGSGIEQLLAIALIVRISDLVKGDLRREAGEVLSHALRDPIEGFWTISETKNLPLVSKPSEIRENVASALSYATGTWVIPYVVEALAREEKSARCRLELTRQLARREIRFSRWLQMLSEISWLDIWQSEASASRSAALPAFRSTKAGGPHVARRFAIPCFESSDGNQGHSRSKWADDVMTDALLRAQVLADTLRGKWSQLKTKDVKEIINEVYDIDIRQLGHLMVKDSAIREPIAAGASRFDAVLGEREEPAIAPIRQYLLVVDAGAGTTDFALFQAITPVGEINPRYALLSKSVRMSRIAGNEIDTILRPLVLKACVRDLELPVTPPRSGRRVLPRNQISGV